MDIPQLVSLNNIPSISDEEAEKYKQKLLKRREYQKNYMAKKRATDPEYVKNSNEKRNQQKKEKYKNDAEYREKERENSKKYNAEEREKIRLAKEHFKNIYGITL
jgi:hypothetical protein